MNFSWLYNLFAIGIRSLSLAAKFLLVLFMVNYFKPAELGLYGVMAAIVAYAIFFLGLEYYNYTSRALVAVSESEQVLVIRDQLILYALNFVILTPFFYLFFHFQIVPIKLCFWFFLIVMVEHISNELMRIFIALARPHLANILFFVRQGLWIYVLLSIFYLYPESRIFNLVFIGWAAGATLSIFIGFSALSYLPWKSIWHHPVRWSEIQEGLKISRPFMISAFCALSLLYIERFFVSYYCGLRAVGVYTFYAGLSITLHTLINTGVSRMRLAHLIGAWKENNPELFYQEAMQMLKYTLIFVVLFSIMSLCFVYPFINLIRKPIYLDHINIFYFLIFAAACRSIADVPLYTLYAQHKDKLILAINLSAFSTLVLGNIFLVPYLGLTGAALSSACASLVLLCYSMLIMLRRTIKPFLLNRLNQGAL